MFNFLISFFTVFALYNSCKYWFWFGLGFGFDFFFFSCLKEIRLSPCYFPSPFGYSLCLLISKIVILDRFNEILKHIW